MLIQKENGWDACSNLHTFRYDGTKASFEAVVLPDIRDVLNKYAPALGCLGVSEDIERIESEE